MNKINGMSTQQEIPPILSILFIMSLNTEPKSVVVGLRRVRNQALLGFRVRPRSCCRSADDL